MKNKKPFVKKLRPLGNLEDIYYTVSNWETKFIDNIEYIYVVKNIAMKDTPRLMRKDNLEVIK